ncbi:MAG: cytochrome C [Deltaproteobacteria bacterium]|nr:cytochrome C [Deltaproteobacteria bacterium]
MGKQGQKIGKLFFLFVVISVIALPVIILQAFFVNTDNALAKVNKAETADFDHKAKQLFGTYNGTTPAYMEGNSTDRTLDYYYSLRVYPGSPPFIPHDLADGKGAGYECLSCHERGGFVQAMNRFTPVTPHPQNTSCRQCHIKMVTKTLFKENDWVSVRPPKLGRSALPGAPPPIAHALQMRENCIACHVGPGTVVPIRVEHPMRGNCRQCHLPEETKALFTRNPK